MEYVGSTFSVSRDFSIMSAIGFISGSSLMSVLMRDPSEVFVTDNDTEPAEPSVLVSFFAFTKNEQCTLESAVNITSSEDSRLYIISLTSSTKCSSKGTNPFLLMMSASMLSGRLFV